MIDRGKKYVEFREAKPYWRKRINNWLAYRKEEYRLVDGILPFPRVIEFRLGYAKNAPTMAFLSPDDHYEFLGADIPAVQQDLGEPSGVARFCLRLGKRIELVD